MQLDTNPCMPVYNNLIMNPNCLLVSVLVHQIFKCRFTRIYQIFNHIRCKRNQATLKEKLHKWERTVYRQHKMTYCCVWLNIGKDATIGTDQHRSNFWRLVATYYNMYHDKTTQAENRWRRLNHDVSKFVGCYEQI